MKTEIKISRWDVAEILETKEDIDIYQEVAYESNDPIQIEKALKNVARVQGHIENR